MQHFGPSLYLSGKLYNNAYYTTAKFQIVFSKDNTEKVYVLYCIKLS